MRLVFWSGFVSSTAPPIIPALEGIFVAAAEGGG